jgi:hypothetical protein
MLALLFVLALGSTASAQAPTPQPGVVKGEKVELIEQLISAHKLLAEADRDYDGHRALAAKEVHKAIKELSGNHHHKKAQTTTPPVAKAKAKHPPMREAQATSDAQLSQALAILQGVQANLSASHPKAATNVTAAIAEINTALKIK